MTDARVDEVRIAQTDLRDYLRIIRRRWSIVVVCVLIGLAVGYLTSKPSSPGVTNTSFVSTTYQATTILSTASATGNDPSGLSLDAMAFLAQSGPVPAMTEKALGPNSGALDIAGRVQVTPKDPLNLMQVTASEPSRNQAAQVANAFAAQVIAYINDQLQVTYNANVSSDRTQLDSLSAVMSKLQAQPPSPTTQSELSVAQGQYAQLYVTYQELLLQGPQHTGLHVINPADPAAAVATSGGITHVITSTSRSTRTALGGLTGLIIGIALALVRDRLDTRIHTREQAERIFGIPVLGEIPRLSGDSARRGLVVVDDPSSTAAESIRMLRTVLALSRPPGGRKGGLGHGLSRAILISSPTRLTAKGEVIANLAASFSEAGNSVALVAVDPFDLSIVGMLGQGTPASFPNGDQAPGLMAASHSNGAAVGAAATGINGVSLLMNGQGSGNGKVYGHGHADLIAQARRSAELVLVDAPPTLATHEAGRLSAVVDSVVLICDLGRVTARDATQTVDMLHRVGAPLHGIVLIAKGGWLSSLSGLSHRRSSRHRPQHVISPSTGVPAVTTEIPDNGPRDLRNADTVDTQDGDDKADSYDPPAHTTQDTQIGGAQGMHGPQTPDARDSDAHNKHDPDETESAYGHLSVEQ